jgi:transposase
MPKENVLMRRIREVLRLCWERKLSERSAARSCCLARSTVAKYLERAQEAGLSWPLPDDLGDEELERRLFSAVPVPRDLNRFVPDWVEVHQELARKGVTLRLLWEEYKQAHPDGYQFSRFSELYRTWRGVVDLPMRQDHKAGEKMFVDYCGQTVPVVADRATGEIREAQVFVAVLGTSNYTCAEACWTQSLPEWIMAHVHAFEYMQGVVELVIPDNLRSAVSSAHLYEPGINVTYARMARHYGCAIVPARVRKPKDKAKAEKGVQDVQHRILAAMRHRTFFSLGEVNEAIQWLLIQHNERPFQKLPGSRRSLFESLDKPALRPLPRQRYEYEEWSKARVNIDYHVAVEGHYYSVPYQLVKQELEIRLTNTIVECFRKGNRVASHLRSPKKGQHTTVAAHMPKSHQQYLEWTPERLVRWAEKTGGDTARTVETILASRPHPQQGFRACLGIMRLGKEYGAERLEAACARALTLQAVTYKSIESILKKELDKRALPQKPPQTPPIEHDNIRGAQYYEEEAESC